MAIPNNLMACVGFFVVSSQWTTESGMTFALAIRIFAALSVLTVVSGMVLWIISSKVVKN